MSSLQNKQSLQSLSNDKKCGTYMDCSETAHERRSTGIMASVSWWCWFQRRTVLWPMASHLCNSRPTTLSHRDSKSALFLRRSRAHLLLQAWAAFLFGSKCPYCNKGNVSKSYGTYHMACEACETGRLAQYMSTHFETLIFGEQ